jgi:peroxiredoxin
MGIAKVTLTQRHDSICKVKVGDEFPGLELPNLEGNSTSLSSLYGPKASVIVFFDQRIALSRMQLADLTPDLVEPFDEQGVRTIIIAVNQTADQVKQQVAAAGATCPTLIDTDGEAFAAVGSEKLPRTYVLDSTGKIVWFDIEYSRSTRRELLGAIDHLLIPSKTRDASTNEAEPAASTASSDTSSSKPM